MEEDEEDDLAPFQIRRRWEKRSACGKICRSCANQGNVISNLSYLYLHNDLIAWSAVYIYCPLSLCSSIQAQPNSLRKISKFFRLCVINFVFVSLYVSSYTNHCYPLHPSSPPVHFSPPQVLASIIRQAVYRFVHAADILHASIFLPVTSSLHI